MHISIFSSLKTQHLYIKSNIHFPILEYWVSQNQHIPIFLVKSNNFDISIFHTSILVHKSLSLSPSLFLSVNMCMFNCLAYDFDQTSRLVYFYNFLTNLSHKRTGGDWYLDTFFPPQNFKHEPLVLCSSRRCLHNTNVSLPSQMCDSSILPDSSNRIFFEQLFNSGLQVDRALQTSSALLLWVLYFLLVFPPF